MSIPATTYLLNSAAPTEIFPYGVQEAVTVINTGSVNVFISELASLSGGVELAPGSSLAWQASTRLYGYTSGGTGQVQVLSADVQTQGDIAVSSIASPVKVQGGGEFIDYGSVTIAAGASDSVPILLPSSGLSYPSISMWIQVEYSGGLPGVNDSLWWQYLGYDSELFHSQVLCEGAFGGYDSTTDQTFGTINEEYVTFPNIADMPHYLDLYNLSASHTLTITYAIWGSAAQLSEPVTNLQYLFWATQKTLTGTPKNLVFPPTHTPFKIRTYYPGTTGDTGALLHFNTASWVSEHTFAIAVDRGWNGSNLRETVVNPSGFPTKLVFAALDATMNISVEPFK